MAGYQIMCMETLVLLKVVYLILCFMDALPHVHYTVTVGLHQPIIPT
jgi:hypothetical protein